ncbi:MAG: hypothetical protein H7062_24875 [Candidatus Saccharimonas sp.]|nr:hypothetical protein [Planctomycetaceae bacterium]
MNDSANSPGNRYCDREVLRQKRRDRWATPLASLAALLHVFVSFIVLAWYFFIVPRLKFEIDQRGKQVSWSVFSQITLSDFVVDYSYLLAPLFVPTAIVLSVTSFLAHRWLARHLGLTCASASAVVVALLIVSNVLFSYTILKQALP